MTAKITVVGSLNMDMVTRTPRFPVPGETLIGTAFQTIPGGKGANQAVAAARLGAQVNMVGRVGNDALGDALLQNLDASGVAHQHVLRCSEPITGTATILVDDSGENFIVVVPGANHQLTPDDVNAAEQVIAASDVLLLQLEIPLETVQRAVELAHTHQVKVVLNPAPAQPLPSDLLSMVDILVPNESETALLAGLSVDQNFDLANAAAGLLDMGIDALILTLGARGSLLAQKGSSKNVAAFEVTPVDTTAAGDAFTAGFAVALAEEKPLQEAARWGNAAGALATTTLGAQTSLPSREAVEALLTGGKTN